jgi:hypothetical protein
MDNVWKKLVVITGNVKGKVFPLQAWAGPWGSGRLRFRIFSTFGAMKVVRSSSLRTGYMQCKTRLCALQPNSCPGHRTVEVSELHTIRHTAGRAPLNEWSVPHRDKIPAKHTTRDTNINALVGIPTGDPSNRAAADLRLNTPTAEWSGAARSC